MNGLEGIVSRILQQAQEDADLTIQKAQEDAEKIIIAAREKADLKKAEIKEKAEKECDEIRKRGDSYVDLEKRKMLLATKREVLDDFYQKIVSRLNDMSAEEYTRFYGSIIEKENGYRSIIFSNEDKDKAEHLINALKAKNIIFEDVSFSDKISHGIILKNGRISIEYSINQIVESYRQDTEAAVAKELFSK